MSHHRSVTHRASRRSVVAGVLVAVLAATGIAGAGLTSAGATRPAAQAPPAAAPAAEAEERTWVVDAVDDERGARWESADTGASDVTIQVGDTVEWQFDRTAQEHDLTSRNTGTVWEPGVQVYRVPDAPPIRYTFTKPGVYEYVCSIHGTTMSGTVVVEEAGAGVEPLPAIDATATPTSGPAPLDVAFSTEVSTGGQFQAFAEGVTSYPHLAGTAELVRRRGETYASLHVTGLEPSASHNVHVHEEACSSDSNGGAHFRFDTTQPFTAENEIWLPFTSDAQGHSGLVEVRQPKRAGAEAVSIVIHDPDNPAQRIGCADLAPSTADLAYEWYFGDGTTATGSDPGHTYTEAGTYTATVTVGHAGQGTGHGATVTDSVRVLVEDATAPQTRIVRGPVGTVGARRATFRFASSETASRFECRLDRRTWAGCSSRATFRGLRDGLHRLRVRATDAAGNTDATSAVARWIIDTHGPAIRDVRPVRGVSDRRPTVRATVRDRLSRVRREELVLRIDARIVPARYHARRDRLAWTPRRALSSGRHAVRLVARDVVGNRTARTWRFAVRR